MDAQNAPFREASKSRVHTFRPPKKPKERLRFLKAPAGLFLERAKFVRSLLKVPRLKPPRRLLPGRIPRYPLLAAAILLLGLGLLPAGFMQPKGRMQPMRQNSFAVTKNMAELSRAMNRHAPFLINKETLLEKASIEGNRLIVRYRLVRRAKEEMDVEAFLKEARPFFLARACLEPKALEVLKSGAAISYAFFDKNGLALGEVPIAWPDCSSLQAP
jgi:hypothetical protein